MGPSESHDKSLTPWRDSDFRKMGSRPKTSPSDGRPTPGLSAIEVDKTPSADHSTVLRPWADNANYSKTKAKPNDPDEVVALREAQKRACRSFSGASRTGDDMSLDLESSIMVRAFPLAVACSAAVRYVRAS
eukprot:COSAG02_NODE_6777_length_3366_cov_2.434956_4_plen_132_part_00